MIDTGDRIPDLPLALSSGAVLASDQRAAGDPDMGRAATACAMAMRAQVEGARLMGLRSPVEELLVTAGTHQHVMRNLARRTGLFLLAWMDRGQASLALTRFKLIEKKKIAVLS